MRKERCILWLMIGALIMSQGCENKGDLYSLSPRQVADLYIKAYNNRDTELLRKIIYFPPGTSEAEIEEKIKPSPSSREAKGAERLLKSAGVKITTKHEKLLSEDAAEVGVVMKMGLGALSKQTPVDQFMMKKDGGIWKFHYAVSLLTKEQLTETIKKDPETAWAYYNLGVLLQSENPYKAYTFFQKYYELEPEGFWVNAELLSKLQVLQIPSKEEKDLLKNLQAYPEKATGRIIIYVRLIQLFTATENFDKAQNYLRQAEELIKMKGSINPDLIAMVEKAKKELCKK